jgi:pilus assembly protein CpaE
MARADEQIRCLLVTADPSLGVSLGELVDRLPGIELSGVARPGAVSGGRPPGCDVVLVADDADRRATALVRELAVAHRGLPAVILSAAPGMDLYRDALAAGARGVVALPPSPSALAAAVSDAHRVGGADADSRREGRAIAVVAGKGGTGATTIALTLALLGRGLLIDAAASRAGVAALVGCRADRSLADLAAVGTGLGADALRSVVTAHASGLRLVGGVAEPDLAHALPAAMGTALVREARRTEALTVIDAGGVSSEVAAEAVAVADRIAIVVTPDAYAVAGGRALAAALTREGVATDRVATVVNRWTRSAEMSLRGIERTVGAPVVAAVRDEPRRMTPLVNGRAKLERWPGRSSLRRLAPLVEAAA